MAADIAGVEAHAPHHGDEHLHHGGHLDVDGQLATFDGVGDGPGHEVAGGHERVVLLLAQFGMSLCLEDRGHQERRGGLVLGVGLDGGDEK